MTTRLETLSRAATLPPSFLGAGTGFDPKPHLASFDRDVSVDALRKVIEAAMAMYPEAPAASDAWLAPRVHAALRLTRREAACREVWNWLAVVMAPDYVRWRYPGNGSSPEDRFMGREDKNAIARLWWSAELMRNGSDYRPVEIGFAMQDIQNTWMRFNAFHHRPLAQAALRVLATWRGGDNATSDQVNRLGKALNTAARTILLESVALDPEFDDAVSKAWVAGEPDGLSLIEDDPVGPEDDPVPEDRIEAMVTLLRSIAARTPALRGDPAAVAAAGSEAAA